ncbi:MAG: ferrous iron transport protein A [Peptococcaceae bacterium]|nr:ferrous iron transport protein A [Peptococcaceae bacterium]
MSELKRGDRATVKHIASELIRAQAIRFGISEGSEVSVEEVLPAGPVILRRGTMQYAIGRNLAQQIQVESRMREKKHA